MLYRAEASVAVKSRDRHLARRSTPNLHELDGGLEQLLTVRQVAGRLGVCTATIYK